MYQIGSNVISDVLAVWREIFLGKMKIDVIRCFVIFGCGVAHSTEYILRLLFYQAVDRIKKQKWNDAK